MMRKMLLGSAMLAMTMGCTGAWAQDASQDMQSPGARAGHVPGVGDSQPSSTRASNIGSNDTRSEIAPSLPNPMVGERGTSEEYLRAARHALDSHRTGVAQEALERAETRLLDRVSQNGISPSQSPAISSLNEARSDLANGDVNGARRAIDQTIQTAQDMRMQRVQIQGQMQQAQPNGGQYPNAMPLQTGQNGATGGMNGSMTGGMNNGMNGTSGTMMGQSGMGQSGMTQPGFGAGNNGMNGMSPNSPYPASSGMGTGMPANNGQSPTPMTGQ